MTDRDWADDVAEALGGEKWPSPAWLRTGFAAYQAGSRMLDAETSGRLHAAYHAGLRAGQVTDAATIVELRADVARLEEALSASRPTTAPAWPLEATK